jgi:hypothetical protein
MPSELRIDGITPLVPVQITSVDAMARKALQDELPGILLRTFIRSIGKATAQYQAERAASKRRSKGDDAAGAMLDLTALALALGSAATESADERCWRSLPATIAIARARLPRGDHRIQLETAAGLKDVEVSIAGRYAFVSLRLIGGNLFAMLPEAPLSGPNPASRSGSEAAVEPPSASEVVAAPRMAQSAVGSQFKPKERMP